MSLLQADGAPSPVARTLIAPPSSRLGPVTPEERRVLIETDGVGDRYDVAVDRDSAAEMLEARAAQASVAEPAEVVAKVRRNTDAAAPAPRTPITRPRAESAGPWRPMAESATRAMGASLGRQVANELGRQVLGGSRRRSDSGLVGGLLRGVLGSLLRR